MRAHAEKLVADGIAAAVSRDDAIARPTKSGGTAFVVKEAKDDGHRLRPILDPAVLNDALDPHYKAEMNLRFVGTYIDHVLDEAAAIGDLAISFFQIVLPDHARAWFRFSDHDGNLYEMLRLPMGHKVAAELMQLAMEAIAGCVHAVTGAPYANPRTRNDVWIDGFRCSGKRHHCQQTLARIVETAKYVGATFKEEPTVNDKYTFIGVAWNHPENCVTVAPKTLNKIGDDVRANAPKSYYEQLVARLIFASGALRIPLANYYFAIKIANRYANALNRGDDDAPVDFPPSILPLLRQWVRAAHRAHYVSRKPPSDKHDTVYVDASTKGWGAYALLATGEVVIIGGAWPGNEITDSAHMAHLEAQAVDNAWRQLRDRLMVGRNTEFKIDNSSVSAAMRRGLARAPELNVRLAATLTDLAKHSVHFTVSLVKSADNLADAPSRLLPTSAVDTSKFNESRGVVGSVAGGGV
jgi:hypothetical protein